MDLLSSSGRSDLGLDALLNACSTFDASDLEQRMLIRQFVVPMLTRKLDFLRVALRAKPGSEPIAALCESLSQAVSKACAKLDSPIEMQACTDVEARIAAASAAIAALPARKPNRKAVSSSEAKVMAERGPAQHAGSEEDTKAVRQRGKA
jgi:hypothetical protein